MGRPRIYASATERQRAFRARRRMKLVQREQSLRAADGCANERDRVLAGIFARYPAVRHLEDVMGPMPAPDEADEVDAFLQFRDQWRQPYQVREEEIS
jgi:hypothetical protein